MRRLHKALDLFFPPQCLSCSGLVAEHGTLCMECWQKLYFLSDPACARCGFPFEYAMGEQALCAGCLHTPPPYSQARSVLRYDEASRPLVLRLKYHDQTSLAPTYGKWLRQAGEPLMQHCAAIVPVPLHRHRLIKRRYNQAALLAYQLQRLSGLPVMPEVLVRTRSTRPQTGLSFAERQKNVKRAFAPHPRHGEQVRDKNVLLVDDVMTTGATLGACTEALHDAGARDVYVLTMARTVHG